MKRLVDVDDDIIVAFTKLFKNKAERIEYNKGFKNESITTNRRTSHVYNKVMYYLFELMITDVINGDIVYLDKKKGARFYVDFSPAPESLILGENIKENRQAPLVNLRMTNYRMPFIAYDPGGERHVCKVVIPMHLYIQLVLKVNSGKKYPKSTKKFWYDRR